MSGILTIFKKELARFFGDKRMAFTAILLPGLLIYMLYSLMGTFITDNLRADTTLTPIVAVTEVPASLSETLEQICVLTPVADSAEAQELLANGEIHAALLFPQDFDALVATYQTGMGDAPLVEMHFDTTDANSYATYETLVALLDAYESALTNKFDIVRVDTATEEAASGQIFASLLPMLLMTLLYSGCTAVATESIAGEKERGTIATLLITPVGRSQIAFGKILALSLISLLSGASSTLGTVLSLPKMMGDMVSGTIYGLREYLLLAMVALSTVLLLVTVISVISTFAKSVKEASTMTAPLMLVVTLVGVLGMAGLGSADNYALYLIPLYNSSQAMSGILSFADATVPVIITALSNLIYSLAGVWLLTKLFQNEKILFNN